jgi:hypothetical protein
MKRSIAALAIAVTLAFAANAQSLDDFKTAFTGFAGDLASTLAVDSTIGANWSDAYIGKFPHFGVGFSVGAAFAPADSATALFTSMNQTFPSALSKIGIPIPAAVGTLKIGIPFLPMDVGIKGGFIPASVGKSLMDSYKVDADYTNFGLQVRYALVKQTLLLPNVSVGAAYNYQKGSIKSSLGTGGKSYTIDTGGKSTTISATDPELALGWKSNTIDLTAQVSKKLLFIVPYLGAGCSFGKSSVTGGVESTISTDYPGGIEALNGFLATIGGPTLTNQGLTYTASEGSPIFRVYGGLSLRIIILDLDVQAMYVTASKSLGATLTTRIQF